MVEEGNARGVQEPGHEREHHLRSVCVFCGSSEGASPAYRAAAASVGTLLARRGLRLIYGGGRIGLMGVVASTAVEAGGEVIGVIPRALLTREEGHEGVSDLRVVGSMHERKALMAELADGFIALPGGFGTLEEFCEIVTWAQLGIHQKPCGLLDVKGFYRPLVEQFDRAVKAGFIRSEHRGIILCERNAERLLEEMEHYEPIPTMKWIDEHET